MSTGKKRGLIRRVFHASREQKKRSANASTKVVKRLSALRDEDETEGDNTTIGRLEQCGMACANVAEGVDDQAGEQTSESSRVLDGEEIVRRESKTNPCGRYVRLLPQERFAYAGLHDMRSPGIESRFTSSDVEATISYLKDRVRLITQKNPFVLGRIHRRRNGASLWIPDKPDSDTFLTEIFVDDTDFDSGLAPCFIEKGSMVIGQDVPIVKLCVIRSRNKSVKDFLVTLCVSHVVGDLHMVYCLWGMLNEDAEVKELIHDRISYRNNPITGLRGAAFRKLLWFVFCSNASPLTHHKRSVSDECIVRFCYLNSEWIEEQKKAHDSSTPGAPYLSTQDIITSWFFNQWETASVAVAYDMRFRAKERGLTSNHMGNYLEGLVLFPKEYSDPANIRRVVSTNGVWEPRRNKPGKKNPRSVGAISGWHSQYEDLQLPLSKRMSHSPLRSASGKLPLLKDPPMMVLFKTSPEQYAMWSLTIGDLKDKRALGDDIVF